MGGSLSSTVHCSRGVPQGSVLGPLLFLLYTKDISDAIPSAVNNQEFADDILLDHSDKDPSVVIDALSRAVTNVATWLDSIGLLVNEKKTQVLFIPPRGVEQPYGRVACRGADLDTVATVKYLGLYIDKHLSWSAHLSHLAVKTRRAVSTLWRHKDSLTIRAKRTWYVSLIQASRLYASNAFFPSMNMAARQKLTTLSKSGIRAIAGIHSPASTSPLLQRHNLHPISSLYVMRVLVFVYRCLHNQTSTLFSSFFLPVPDASSSCRVATRGSVSRLLSVPFLRGPSGRSSIRFKASVGWNSLPATIRCLNKRETFRDSLHVYVMSHHVPLS